MEEQRAGSDENLLPVSLVKFHRQNEGGNGWLNVSQSDPNINENSEIVSLPGELKCYTGRDGDVDQENLTTIV